MQKSTTKVPFTKKEKNWILYDVANSAYTLLATALLAFYFDFLSPSESLTTVWGFVNVIVTVIAVILCPILGTYADFSKKHNVFLVCAEIGIVGCALLSVFSTMSTLPFDYVRHYRSWVYFRKRILRFDARRRYDGRKNA